MSAVIEEFGGVDVSGRRLLGEVQKGYTAFLAGDVLFAKITPCMENGKVAVVPQLADHLGYGSTEFHVVRAREAVHPSWLAYFLSQSEFRRLARQHMTGSAGQLRVATPWLAATGIPVAPLAEQTRIVTKLEELLSDLDAGVAELKAAQKKLAQYRQSLLKSAVEGRLTAEWRDQQTTVRAELVEAPSVQGPSTSSGRTGSHETGTDLLARIQNLRRARWEAKQLARFKEQGKTPPKGWQASYPEPVAPDTAGLPALPESWVWSALGQCFRVAVGATPSRAQADYWNGGIPWVSSGEVRFNRITATKECISLKGMENSSTGINSVGSVLLGMIGEGKTRGQVALLGIPAANNQNCAAIWVSETEIAPEFVYFWLWSRYEQTRSTSSGNNQPALNKSIVERIPFPLPPLDELMAITESLKVALEHVEQQELAIERSLKQSTAQRKNILRAAFAGQLVPQDPNDEPASALLDRIRVARKESAEVPHRRKIKGRA